MANRAVTERHIDVGSAIYGFVIPRSQRFRHRRTGCEWNRAEYKDLHLRHTVVANSNED